MTRRWWRSLPWNAARTRTRPAAPGGDRDGPPDRPKLPQLAEADCWRVAGLKNASLFFRAVPRLLPDATHLFLEGSSPDVEALLAPHLEPVEYTAPIGTIWSWPPNRRLVVRCSTPLFDELADAATRRAEPEICAHLHFYRNGEPLAHWFDAFGDPLSVSKMIARALVEDFARAAGGTLVDPSPR